MTIEPNSTPPPQSRQIRGLALFSGGLDSQLAICVLREQGIEVEGIVFSSPFFKLNSARQAAQQLGIKLHVFDFTRDILELVEHPPHGFGGNMNPCIDCHARMIRRAGEVMARVGFNFVATGEVLNQRPMSQNRRALGMVAKSAAINNRLLRPLSAQLLEPTAPELEGIVDRAHLLALNGRSRKPQVALAERYGIVEYPAPAGGCLLTEDGFCRKLADLKAHEGFADERLVWLLLHGRHFRLPTGIKCIVGRDKSDNQALRKAALPADTILHTVDVPGPTILITGNADMLGLSQAATLCAAYADTRGRDDVLIRIIQDDRIQETRVPPLAREKFKEWLC